MRIVSGYVSANTIDVKGNSNLRVMKIGRGQHEETLKLASQLLKVDPGARSVANFKMSRR